jgi:hypothetical protein
MHQAPTSSTVGFVVINTEVVIDYHLPTDERRKPIEAPLFGRAPSAMTWNLASGYPRCAAQPHRNHQGAGRALVTGAFPGAPISCSWTPLAVGRYWREFSS